MQTKCIQMERRDLVILQGRGEFTWKISDCEAITGAAAMPANFMKSLRVTDAARSAGAVPKLALFE